MCWWLVRFDRLSRNPWRSQHGDMAARRGRRSPLSCLTLTYRQRPARLKYDPRSHRCPILHPSLLLHHSLHSHRLNGIWSAYQCPAHRSSSNNTEIVRLSPNGNLVDLFTRLRPRTTRLASQALSRGEIGREEKWQQRLPRIRRSLTTLPMMASPQPSRVSRRPARWSWSPARPAVSAGPPPHPLPLRARKPSSSWVDVRTPWRKPHRSWRPATADCPSKPTRRSCATLRACEMPWTRQLPSVAALIFSFTRPGSWPRWSHCWKRTRRRSWTATRPPCLAR